MKEIIMRFILILAIMIIFSDFVCADMDSSKLIITSLVNQDPDPAIAGDVVEVRVCVENHGGIDAENLMLEFIPQYPFAAISGENNLKEVGTLKAYQIEAESKIVKFKVRVDLNATPGEYELKIKEYENGTDISITRSINIEVKNKENAEVIYIDKTLLVPGKQTTLNFTINNVGNAPLRDLIFSWENKDEIILPVGSDNTKYIKSIGIGDSAELSYQVIADTNAVSGLYKLDLHLSYDNSLNGEEENTDTIAGIYVGGGTDFDIAFSEISSGSTSFTIANIGSNPAVSVSIIIPRQEGWKVSGPNSMIIGNLNTGDYTVASFVLQYLNIMPSVADEQKELIQEKISTQRTTDQSQNKLKIQIAYTDTMGQRELIEKEININRQTLMGLAVDSENRGFKKKSDYSKSPDNFFSQYQGYIIGLIILMVVGLMYRKYKREKFLNPNFKFRNLFEIKASSRKKSKSK